MSAKRSGQKKKHFFLNVAGAKTFFAFYGFMCVQYNVCAASLCTNGCILYMFKKYRLNMHILGLQNIRLLTWLLWVPILK